MRHRIVAYLDAFERELQRPGATMGAGSNLPPEVVKLAARNGRANGRLPPWAARRGDNRGQPSCRIGWLEEILMGAFLVAHLLGGAGAL